MKVFRLALAIALVAAGLIATPRSQTPAYDVILKGGRVLDGSGNPWFYGDVGGQGRPDRGGRMRSEPRRRRGRSTPRGKIVTPGFIDLHSHGDGGLANDGAAARPNMVAQGITLSVVNQDGRSPRWPIRDQKALYEKQGIGHERRAAGRPRHAAHARHGPARQPDRHRRRHPGDAEARRRRDGDGAFGLSTGLEYNPGRFSETREVVALTRMVKPYGGFYISHERSEGADPMWKVTSDPTPFVSLIEAVNETITIGRETGVPVVASHLKAKGASYWGSSQAATRLIREARAQGLEVYADQYPYETSGTDGSTVLIPGWAISRRRARRSGDQLEAGGGGGRGGRGGGGAAIKERFKQRLGNDDDVRKIRMDIAHEIDRRGGAAASSSMTIPDAKYVGKSLQFVADDLKMGRRRRRDLAAAERRRPRRRRAHARASRSRKSTSTTSCSRTSPPPAPMATSSRLGEGLPHARFYGTMPRKIRRYVLDRSVISLPFAIRSMTSLPAQIMGLKDRGLLRTGYWADLVVFDLETIADKATFTEPHQYPTGIPYVLREWSGRGRQWQAHERELRERC